MCRERLFQATGWSHLINDLGNKLQLYRNSNISYVNSAAVLTVDAVKEGWVYNINDLILPELSKCACVFLK